MACSKYEYVRKFEEVHSAMLQTYILIRVDGRGFTKFCAAHDFEKPNDLRAIKLMNAAAQEVCNKFPDIILAYGQSDEYSFLFNRNTGLFSRRTDKIVSCLVSTFTAAYVWRWGDYFESPMKQLATFDGRAVVYPNEQCVKDYFRWRQVDCHINNLYNTVFWCMIKAGKSNTETENILKDTNSAKKNEMLFSDFKINYNTLPEIYRRGTFYRYQLKAKEKVQVKMQIKTESEEVKQEAKEQSLSQVKEKTQSRKESKEQQTQKQKKPKKEKLRRVLGQCHDDCIKQPFWQGLLQG